MLAILTLIACINYSKMCSALNDMFEGYLDRFWWGKARFRRQVSVTHQNRLRGTTSNKCPSHCPPSFRSIRVPHFLSEFFAFMTVDRSAISPSLTPTPPSLMPSSSWLLIHANEPHGPKFHPSYEVLLRYIISTLGWSHSLKNKAKFFASVISGKKCQINQYFIDEKISMWRDF